VWSIQFVIQGKTERKEGNDGKDKKEDEKMKGWVNGRNEKEYYW
jgi:hypothetical protein